MTAAYVAQEGDDRIGSMTLLNTMLDYSEPGVLGLFADEKTVSRLEQQMAADGVLDGSKMAATFDVLQANELIFSYVVSNWLMGQDPPACDILAWNADSTRMPAAMQSHFPSWSMLAAPGTAVAGADQWRRAQPPSMSEAHEVAGSGTAPAAPDCRRPPAYLAGPSGEAAA